MNYVQQVGGDHYQKPIQAWDYIIANGIGFLEGNAIKYLSRWKDKDGLKDLEKAKSYIDKLIAIEKARQESSQEGESNLLTPAEVAILNAEFFPR